MKMPDTSMILSDYVPRAQYDAAAADADHWHAESKRARSEAWEDASNAFEGQLRRVLQVLTDEQRAALLSEHIGASAYVVTCKLTREEVLDMMTDILTFKAQESA